VIKHISKLHLKKLKIIASTVINYWIVLDLQFKHKMITPRGGGPLGGWLRGGSTPSGMEIRAAHKYRNKTTRLIVALDRHTKSPWENTRLLDFGHCQV